MKKTRILLLPFLVVILVALACNSDDPLGVTDTPQLLFFYPVKYTGTVNIDNGNVCTNSASATFTALGDNTCSLVIQFSDAYQNFEGLMPGDAGYGACKETGDTIAWYLFGKFDQSSFSCTFQYCNDVSLYSASGFLGFDYFSAHSGLPITCANAENGKTDITVFVNSLPIVKP